MQNKPRSVGIIGFGQIGSYVYEQITSRPELGLSVAFVYSNDKKQTAQLPSALQLDRLEDFASKKPDMICELAHPDISRQYGAMFLEKTDYFMLSVTALADAALEESLKRVSLQKGTRLFIPHGGVMGLETIIEGRDSWEDVTFIMKKHPRNLDFARAGIDPATIKSVTTLYDGPTRGICPKYPRNVNTHATVAIAGIGFDRTHSVLVADPSLETFSQEILVRGGGVSLQFKLVAEMKGVTGSATLRSVVASMVSTTPRTAGVQFC